MMAKRIKLMAEYSSPPLWWDEPEHVGPIDPTKLPISADLLERLMKWAELYDRQLNIADPKSSHFLRGEDLDDFERVGREIWKRLREELAPHYEVVYFSEREGKIIADPQGFVE